MKQICITLVLVFFLSNCSQPEYDYKAENIILDCFYEHHKDNDIDIKITIDKIEDVLLKHNVLEDKSGKSYIQIIKKIKDDNTFYIDNPDLLEDIKSIGYIPSSVSCNDTSYASLLDSASVAKSKLKYLIGIFDSIQVKGDISPTLIAEEILEVFNDQDFENDYYRTIGLVMFSSLIKFNDYDNGLARQLPPIEEKESPPVIEPQNVFTIRVNSKDEMLVNGNRTEILELKSMIIKFLLESSDKVAIELPEIGEYMSSKGVISIEGEKGTSYKFYLLVQNEIASAYKELRNRFSNEIFRIDFDSLSDEQKWTIKKIVPQRISEAEPKTN
jgi:biopolymer transport protein ExbD